MKNVLILSCSTGEGHNSAAHAIEAVLTTMGIRHVMADPVAFQSQRMERLVAGLYNTTIRKKPEVFGAVYRLGDFYCSKKLPSPVYWANAHYSEALLQYIRQEQFDAVICTHLYGLEAMTALRKKGKLTIPFYGILTDYTSIPFMEETQPDCFFVPNQETKDYLISRDVPEDRIIISGIPVGEAFRDHPGKEEARRELDLPQDRKIYLVMTGGVGCENMEGLCDALLADFPENAMLLVLTGKNEELKNRLEEKYGEWPCFRTVSFTKQVPLYMASADVLLSKPGGLSTTEAAVANVPLVHIHAIPGCETCNAEYFSAHGLSLWAKDPEEAVRYARFLAEDREAAETMLTQQRRLINPNAARFIAEKVISQC